MARFSDAAYRTIFKSFGPHGTFRIEPTLAFETGPRGHEDRGSEAARALVISRYGNAVDAAVTQSKDPAFVAGVVSAREILSNEFEVKVPKMLPEPFGRMNEWWRLPAHRWLGGEGVIGLLRPAHSIDAGMQERSHRCLELLLRSSSTFTEGFDDAFGDSFVPADENAKSRVTASEISERMRPLPERLETATSIANEIAIAVLAEIPYGDWGEGIARPSIADAKHISDADNLQVARFEAAFLAHTTAGLKIDGTGFEGPRPGEHGYTEFASMFEPALRRSTASRSGSDLSLGESG